MGLRINTNIAAINAHRQLGITDTKMAQSMERLSSGYRINRAKDDAAGLAIAQKFAAQVRSLGVASQNASQANSLLQMAEGGADQIHTMLLRLKELATQAASYNNLANLNEIDAEAQKLLSEINRIAQATKYLDTALLTGFGVKGAGTLTAANTYGFDVSGAAEGTYTISAPAAGGSITVTKDSVSQTLSVTDGQQTLNFSTFGISLKTTEAFLASNVATIATAFSGSIVVSGTTAAFQVGDKNDTHNQISFEISSIDYDVIGSATVAGSAAQLDDLRLDTVSHAQYSLDIIDQAIADVNTVRGVIGAIQNRLGYTYANLQISIENLSAAESVIRDVDMAYEMVNFTKTQILMQSGTAMLAQANLAPQNVLALLGR